MNHHTTHCPKGHAYIPENTYVVPATGGWQCKICKRGRNRDDLDAPVVGWDDYMSLAALEEGSPCVYGVFSEQNVCLYVGCTNHLTQRMAGHRTSSTWYNQASYVQVIWESSRESALDLEWSIIAVWHPIYNVDKRAFEGIINGLPTV